ncbi:unnamed protein product [Caenorhabditis auriculariae]|uniref:Uncharacterized protein n=1 Tax=Caenorhabditis auriculariae TaxID=2777116 RepID=A0A8S1HB59_9PELO|nr:unnamed protein product [Caenorhabditis auriculariae]
MTEMRDSKIVDRLTLQQFESLAKKEFEVMEQIMLQVNLLLKIRNENIEKQIIAENSRVSYSRTMSNVTEKVLSSLKVNTELSSRVKKGDYSFLEEKKSDENASVSQKEVPNEPQIDNFRPVEISVPIFTSSFGKQLTADMERKTNINLKKQVPLQESKSVVLPRRRILTPNSLNGSFLNLENEITLLEVNKLKLDFPESDGEDSDSERGAQNLLKQIEVEKRQSPIFTSRAGTELRSAVKTIKKVDENFFHAQ